jgi:hypothetical protein
MLEVQKSDFFVFQVENKNKKYVQNILLAPNLFSKFNNIAYLQLNNN